MDPFPKPQPRHAPGAKTIADFLVPTTKPPAPKPNAVTAKETLQLAAYAQQRIEAAARLVGKEYDLYLQPTAPGLKPPGQGFIQQKPFEQIGELVAPSRIVKTILQLGEGQAPGVSLKTGHGHGLGVGEEDRIFHISERQRAEREQFLADLAARQSRARVASQATSPFASAVPSASIQPEHIQPVNAAALANQAAAEGIRAVLVSERADP